MLNRFKLGSKIFGSFIIVLILLAAVAYVGVNGLSSVSGRVETADSVNQLVQGILSARQWEKNFIIRSDKAFADKTIEQVNRVKALAFRIKTKFDQTSNKKQMDLVIRKVNDYETAFKGYADLEQKKKASLDEMHTKAEVALLQAENIRASQEVQLAQDQAQNADLINDHLAKADDANRIIKWLLDARTAEKSFILQGAESHKKRLLQLATQISTLAQKMKSELTKTEHQNQTDQIIAGAQAYLKSFKTYTDLSNRQKEAVATMDTHAEALEAEATAIRERQKVALLVMEGDENADPMLKDIKLRTLQDADGIIKMTLAVQVKAKGYMTAGATGDQEQLAAEVKRIIFFARDLTFRFVPGTEERKRIGKILKKAKGYLAAFKIYQEIHVSKTAAEAEMEKIAKHLENLARTIRESQKNELQHVRQAADAFLKNKLTVVAAANRITQWLFEARKNEKEFILSGDRQYFEAVGRITGQIPKLGKEISALVQSEKSIQQVDAASVAVKAYSAAFDQFAQMMDTQTEADKRMLQAAQEAQKVCSDALSEQKKMMQKRASWANRIMLICALMAVLLGLGFAFLTTRGITQPLNRVISGLSQGSDHVTTASGQVSSASQSLADGASDQAASIEEISSSLEEMSSMTKQNAENSNQANNLVKQSNLTMAEANGSMSELTGSMEAIQKASEETSKIIKTIDEIAFQTNLLALNAAVEAARAGEAGAGFAVVADEVRNLAMRAADAARNTAGLIEGTVERVNKGSALVSKTNAAFQRMAEDETKVGGLVAEVASASKEQSQGIEQINQSVINMDKVVQQNAASAEESASASEEMIAQAQEMRYYVSQIVALVAGNSNTAPAAGQNEEIDGSEEEKPEKEVPAWIEGASTDALVMLEGEK